VIHTLVEVAVAVVSDGSLDAASKQIQKLVRRVLLVELRADRQEVGRRVGSLLDPHAPVRIRELERIVEDPLPQTDQRCIDVAEPGRTPDFQVAGGE
jgi:hypothetical protein